MRYYTGIGSRQTPKSVLDMMKEIGTKLAREGFVLRSGGAPGADSVFEIGCDSEKGEKEIFLPWLEFNGKQGIVYQPTDEYRRVLRENHPNMSALNHSSRLLLGRNYLELVGQNNVKSEFVIAYDLGSGGTNYTCNLARKLGIPVYNLYDSEILEKFKEWLTQ